MKEYNTTQLNPESSFERHVFHRDQFAHYLRWSHVLKIAKIGQKIMDFGCGNANLYEVFYRNRYSPERYLGLDIRKQTIEKNKTKFPKAEFKTEDLVNMSTNYGTDWDIITSFEVAEHVQKINVPKFLENIKDHCNENTIILISTPKYDEKVGAADNHIYAGGPQELTYDELHDIILSTGFKIEKVYGTFASQKDYKDKMNEWQQKMFDSLSSYYDTNLISVMMAPIMDADLARNCLWVLKKA